ncbi:MAG: hypothetical protein LBT36_02925, partial [Oscillospiraceae bacterium]|nr:hypothetical protein [Oscillospiraceae bacterium]
MTNPKRESRVPRFRRAVRRKTRAVRRRAVRAIRGRQRAAAIAAAAILLVTVSIAAAARGLGLRGALLQTRREVSARLAETPFARLDTFLTAMTDGGIGADFSVTDARGDTYAGRVAYASDSKRGKALTAELTLAGAPLDFALYVNRERAALRDSRVGQDTIGFRYDTFERDIAVLARKTGLADETVSRLTDAARRLETAQSGDAATLRPDNLTEPLDKLLDKFWKSLHFERSRADDAARYTAAIPAARLAELAEDIYAAYYDGGTLGALYELLALPAYSPFYNALAMDALGRGGADEAAYFARLAAMLGDLKENLTGELTLTFDVI